MASSISLVLRTAISENRGSCEKMYDILLDYEQNIHQKNQKKIRIGLKCVVLIPLIFLILLFWTESSKIIFLVLWIVSVFVIATYLIAVEYQDYKLQEKLNELNEETKTYCKFENTMSREDGLVYLRNRQRECGYTPTLI